MTLNEWCDEINYGEPREDNHTTFIKVKMLRARRKIGNSTTAKSDNILIGASYN